MKKLRIIFVLAILISAIAVLGCTSSSGTSDNGASNPSSSPSSSATNTPTAKPTPTPTPAPASKVGMSMKNPAAIGDSVTFVQGGGVPYTATMTIEQVVRGDEAQQMLEKANMFNGKYTDTSLEHMLIKVKFSLDKYDGYDYSGKHIDTLGVSDSDFQSVSDKKYESSGLGVVEPSPAFGDRLFDGGISEGWVELAVYKDDPHPYIVWGDTSAFSSDVNVWFQV
jgi:hypothetical protein